MRDAAASGQRVDICGAGLGGDGRGRRQRSADCEDGMLSSRGEDRPMGWWSTRRVVVGLVAALALVGCAGADEVGGPADDPDDPDGTPAATSAPDDDPTDGGPTGDGEAGSGTATVEVDGQTFTFRVIQCLRDVPGAMGGTVAFQLDGVPPDTPTDLIEPLLGPVDPDADVQGTLAPVFEVGPILSVSRVTDGGDFVAISTGPGEAYVTTANVSSAEERYLDISDATSGATVQGTAEMATPSGPTSGMLLDAVCP
jgi:hypothetical protein